MGEPVGWIYEDDEGRMMFSQMPQNSPLWEPVYRAKKQWQGLTDEEMFSLWVKCPDEIENRFAFARAIEAALKEKNA